MMPEQDQRFDSDLSMLFAIACVGWGLFLLSAGYIIGRWT